jgi:hypothetical protein
MKHSWITKHKITQASNMKKERNGENFTYCEWIQQCDPQWEMEGILIVCPTSNSKLNNTVYLRKKINFKPTGSIGGRESDLIF